MNQQVKANFLFRFTAAQINHIKLSIFLTSPLRQEIPVFSLSVIQSSYSHIFYFSSFFYTIVTGTHIPSQTPSLFTGVVMEIFWLIFSNLYQLLEEWDWKPPPVLSVLTRVTVWASHCNLCTSIEHGWPKTTFYSVYLHLELPYWITKVIKVKMFMYRVICDG